MDNIAFFWNGWEPLLRILIVGTLTYISIVAILRVSGKRTLASMNAFDFIVTVALGSIFGRILTAKQISVSEAVVAFLLLVSLQYIISYIEVRSKLFHRLIKSQPTLLYYNGKFLKKNMLKQRLRQKDLIVAVRKQQFSSLSQIDAIILETDGKFSVIKKGTETDNSSFGNLLEE